MSIFEVPRSEGEPPMLVVGLGDVTEANVVHEGVEVAPVNQKLTEIFVVAGNLAVTSSYPKAS